MSFVNLKKITPKFALGLAGRHPDYFFVGILFLIGTIAYYQTLKMYFWLDDYTYLYYAKFLEQSVFQFPYQFGLVLARILFPIFGLTAYWYYLLGILFFLTSLGLAYTLAVMIFRKKILAFLAGLVFASGYIGQGSLFMVIGDGLYVLLGVDALIITLIVFLRYLENKKISYLVGALLSFATCLEIAPTRFAGVLPIVIAAEFILGKDYLVNKIKRISLFAAVFYLQYVIHPTEFLLGYTSAHSPSSPSYFFQQLGFSQLNRAAINIFGSFGNLFIPTYFRTTSNFWVAAIPIFITNTGLILLFTYLRSKTISSKQIFLMCLLLSIMSFLFFLVSANSSVPVYRFSILNGLMMFNLFLTCLFLGLSRNRRMSLFLLVMTFSILSIFSVMKPEIVIDSDHRYLLASAFVPQMLLFILAPQELYEKSSKNRKIIAWIIFLIPIVLLTVSHLYLAMVTQAKFVNQYASYRQPFFQQLKIYIPKIDGKTAIYVEGSSKQMNYVLGDIQRVGTLGPEASFAVNYQTMKSNIILPATTSGLLRLIKNKQLNVNQVFAFVYDGNRLINATQSLRNLLENPSQEVKLAPSWQVVPTDSFVESDGLFVRTKTHYFENSQGTLGIYPKVYFSSKNRVSSQLPIRLDFEMKAELAESLNYPYFQLDDTNILTEPRSWPEKLNWRSQQCRHGLKEQPFDCVSNQQTFEGLKTSSGKVRISWQYDSYGLLSQSKQKELTLPLDGLVHQYQLTIPAGGQYIKQIAVEYVSFPGELSINLDKMTYAN